ncbi:18489_t:CDS:2, partial [Racocetra fulgida]
IYLYQGRDRVYSFPLLFSSNTQAHRPQEFPRTLFDSRLHHFRWNIPLVTLKPYLQLSKLSPSENVSFDWFKTYKDLKPLFDEQLQNKDVSILML